MAKKVSTSHVVWAVVVVIATAFLWTAVERRTNSYFDSTPDPND